MPSAAAAPVAAAPAEEVAEEVSAFSLRVNTH
jgi:hypothetical protein